MTPAEIHARLSAISATLPKNAFVEVAIVGHRSGQVEAVCYPFGLGNSARITAKADNFEAAIDLLEAKIAKREWLRDALIELHAKQAKERAALIASLGVDEDAAE